MVKPEVVAYLQANLKKHPIDELRRQLSQEGVGDVDFDDSLKAAMRAPPTVATATGAGRSAPSRASVVFLVAGVAVVAALTALLALRREPPPPPPSSTTVVSATGESAFVGNTGYVIRLPKGYEAVAAFKDEKKTIEIVHFCRAGTDPTNFVHGGLFGQMGIVRLVVQPNPWAGDIMGPDRLARAISGERTARGDKFAVKSIQVSSLRGVQVQTELPDISVESYILGETVLYHFYAGQEDEVYRDIVNSLRDPNAETL
ncbi:MAG: hypothetical protein NTY77_14795 [Elusimicrobia bacterium]|nr:hypothetical protein [Elusimicrobiota bacterium]